ncbi:hypothetical protein [Bathymodiolus platifrons methanotrophic gill symbiont]|uniref:hypothetical protein n=1 Tax=Bathymodiolus platifrons methanotrophic gill symbiont TaxID=113268 RepID=UPI001C8EC0A1|nr:hypothetical protein [Bathymodiolus platifrons methanotrophic gill symbiont]
MEWSIEYYSPEVEESILGLPEGFLSRYFRLTDLREMETNNHPKLLVFLSVFCVVVTVA